jgi:hypothetical protein
MPYADSDEQREFRREWFKGKYQSDPKFRRAQCKRANAKRATRTKKEVAENREYMREYMRQYRAARKKAKSSK